jgi:hypothetical protein
MLQGETSPVVNPPGRPRYLFIEGTSKNFSFSRSTLINAIPERELIPVRELHRKLKNQLGF